MPHCWKGYREHLEDIGKIYTPEWAETYERGSKTCMLENGHGGEHDFVDDSAIVITFKDNSVVVEG